MPEWGPLNISTAKAGVYKDARIILDETDFLRIRPSEKSLVEVRKALQQIDTYFQSLRGAILRLQDLTPVPLATLMTEDGLDFLDTETPEDFVQEWATTVELLNEVLWSLGGVDTGWIVNEDDSGDEVTYEDDEKIYLSIGGHIEHLKRNSMKRITSGPYTVLSTDEVLICDTDGGAFEVDLPAGIAGVHLKIVNVGGSGNDVTVDPNGLEQIFGGGAGVAYALTDGNAIRIHFHDSEGWW